MAGIKKMLPMSRALRPGGAGTVKPQGGGLDLGLSKPPNLSKSSDPLKSLKSLKFMKGGRSKR